MKFAHIADVHIGGWRDPKMSELGVIALRRTFDDCIKREVDFVLIAGDLFNTSLPSIDKLKQTVAELKRLKDAGINVYMIAGSHDFSPSGKTMLDVLEEAGLIINVVRGQVIDDKLKLNFTLDGKTGVKITGMLGKKGMLEKIYYENLHRENLEKEGGYKIFMFHSALAEFKPQELANMDAHPLSLLPKNFNYYAGGHVHYIFEKDEKDYGKIVYPGALFPNNFSELEKFGGGGYYLVDDDSAVYIPIIVKSHIGISVKSKHNTPLELEHKIIDEIEKVDYLGKLVTIRVSGVLENGKVSDIDFNRIFSKLEGAYFVMKNTNALKTKDFEEIKISAADSKEVEQKLVKEHVSQVKVKDMDPESEEKLTHQLMSVLNTEKQEGEKVVTFHQRILDDAMKLLNL